MVDMAVAMTTNGIRLPARVRLVVNCFSSEFQKLAESSLQLKNPELNNSPLKL